MKTVAFILLLVSNLMGSDLWPANGLPGSREEPSSPFTIRIDSDGKVKIGAAILSLDQATEILRAVLRMNPTAHVVIETNMAPGWGGGVALMQFANRAGFDISKIWFRFDPSKTIGEIKKEAEQAAPVQPATRPESKSEGNQKPQPESVGCPR